MILVELRKILAKHVAWLQSASTGKRANLHGANLKGASLRGANLRGANLWDANLQGANLRGTILRNANLQGANLRDANLEDADLRPEDIAVRSIVPAEGSFVGYKKVAGGAILTLCIPASAKRVGGLLGRKCRASAATVMASSKGTGPWFSSYAPRFSYPAIGATVKVPDFCEDACIECAAGIHFFLTADEARTYY